MVLKIAKTLKSFYQNHEKRIGIAFTGLGFTIDSLTLKRIDLLFENLVLCAYLTIALLSIVIINAYESGKLNFRFMRAIHVWLPLPLQYAFGGLFSGFVIFYTQSASFISSWPFMVMLVAILVGNEFAKTQYARFTYHVTVFYTALFSFAIFFVPVMTKRFGPGIFLLSGMLSLLGIAVILLFLRSLARKRFEKSHVGVIASITTVYLLFHFMYFTNIIPPIPLSLKAIGVYHTLKSQSGAYTAYAEPAPWNKFYNDTSLIFHRHNTEPVYVFSSVFAPTNLTTPISHVWSFFDQTTNDWKFQDRFSFFMVGGRDGGYRGYSFKQNVRPGKWRVDVVTERNQLIGRITFTVSPTELFPQTKPVKL